MKVLQVCLYEDGGGAPRAANRLNRALVESGCDSRLYVLHKNAGDPRTVEYAPAGGLLNRLAVRARRRVLAAARRGYRVSGGWMYDDDRSPFGGGAGACLPECDLVHLHWIAGFLDHRAFFRRHGGRLPVVWTLHDMSAFTGGCYFDGGCGRFRGRCGACPRLGSSEADDLSAAVWRRKERAYRALPDGALHLVALSRWMEGQVKASSLLSRFPVTLIPNGIDHELYRPIDRAAARAALGVPADARAVLFLAHGVDLERKGMHLLLEALARLGDVPNLLLLSVGAGAPQLPAGLAGRHLGSVQNELFLPIVYSAADAFALPSLQDNLPNVMLEAMSCGLPVVGFACGGIAETVRNGDNGLTVPVGDTAALAKALRAVLEDTALRDRAGAGARETILRGYTLRHQAERHLALYKRLLGAPGKGEVNGAS